VGLNCRHIHDYLALPLLPIVQEIGLRGLPVDQERRTAMIVALDVRLSGLDATLEREYKIVDANSDRKLGWQLRALGVPLTKMTDSGQQFKLDAEILGRLNWEHNVRHGRTAKFPFLPDLIRRSRIAKAAENVRSIVPCRDGLVRTALKSCHTATARYASTGFGRKNKAGFCPVCREWGEHGTNLQNIARGCSLCGSSPRDCTCEGGGIHIKSLFRALPGWRLGEWDYAALELRIMAYRVGSRKLIERLERGDDLHTLHAQLMFPGAEINKRRRTLAKNFIYAIRGAGGDRAVQIALAKKDEYVEQSEIAGWRRAIFAEYPEIPTWISETEAMLAEQAGRRERRCIRNAFGRPRVLLGYVPLKEALADEISATAADIMNFVALRLAYEQPGAMQFVAMQIHDSFIIHAPEVYFFPSTMNIVLTAMERPVWQWGEFVTYPAEAKAGGRWSELSAWPS